MFLNLGSPPKGPPPPFSAWQMRHIKVIERAIAMAWTQAMNTAHGRALLASGKEPEITAMLQDALTILLESKHIHGFSPAVFGAPIRGQELEDYSGRYLEKRPDLTFPRLSARPTTNHNALFYECKVLGRGRTVNDYISDGVARFQNGHYAWAMQHAGMIGYVAELNHKVNACAVLSQRWTQQTKPAPCAPVAPVAEDQSSAPWIAISIHARPFILRNGIPPGDITLRHMWLVGLDRT
jgi:hypothetical protein